jgi:hypothetical protein
MRRCRRSNDDSTEWWKLLYPANGVASCSPWAVAVAVKPLGALSASRPCAHRPPSVSTSCFNWLETLPERIGVPKTMRRPTGCPRVWRGERPGGGTVIGPALVRGDGLLGRKLLALEQPDVGIGVLRPGESTELVSSKTVVPVDE